MNKADKINLNKRVLSELKNKKQIINTVNVLGLDFNIYKGPVGICCSGGADSTMLLYMLMLNCVEKIHIFTMVSNFKQRKPAYVIEKIIEACIQLTGNINVEHHMQYYNDHTVDNILEIPNEWLSKKYITTAYTGITNTPPPEELKTSYKAARPG